MSAETDQSSGGSPALRSPTTSQQSTQTLLSEEEGSEEEVSSPLSHKEGYLEEDESLDQETYLKGKEYLKKKEYLQEEKGLGGKDYLTEEERLERKFKVAPSLQTSSNINARIPAASVSQVTTFLTAPPPTSEPAREPPFCDTAPSASFMKDGGEFLGWRDQGTQTKWIYESMAPVKSKLKAEKESSVPILPTLKSDLEEHIITELQEEEKVFPENFLDDILNEPIDMLGAEDVDDNLFNSNYQSVFRTMIEEMAARNELEEGIDIPLTGDLGSETRRKLGLVIKTNFEKYKKILWLVKKREKLLNPKASDMCTFTFHLQNQSPQAEEPKVEEVKERHDIGLQEKKLEIDTQWVKSKVKVPQGDVKLTLYPSENIFQILFPDGSGQIHYPSGHLAVLILSTKEGTFTYEYIVLEDGKNGRVRALINNTGHATFYDENGVIWASLSRTLGYYFAKGKPQKAWNWWHLSQHVHAPPVQSISLNINRHIKVQIGRQDEITFHFTHQTRHVCLNLGTKYKSIAPEVLSEMKKAAVLEVEVGPTAQKMHGLLGKMNKILNFLTLFDLENFLEATKILMGNNVSLRKESYLPG